MREYARAEKRVGARGWVRDRVGESAGATEGGKKKHHAPLPPTTSLNQTPCSKKRTYLPNSWTMMKSWTPSQVSTEEQLSSAEQEAPLSSAEEGAPLSSTPTP